MDVEKNFNLMNRVFSFENVKKLLEDPQVKEKQIKKGIELFFDECSKLKDGFEIQQTRDIPSFLSILERRLGKTSPLEYKVLLSRLISIVNKSKFSYDKISSKLSRPKLMSQLIYSFLSLLKGHSSSRKAYTPSTSIRIEDQNSSKESTMKKIPVEKKNSTKTSKLMKYKICHCISGLIKKNSCIITEIFTQEIIELSTQMLGIFVNVKEARIIEKDKVIIYCLLKILKECSRSKKNSQYVCQFSYKLLLNILNHFPFDHLFVSLTIEIIWNMISHDEELKIKDEHFKETLTLLFKILKKSSGVSLLEDNPVDMVLKENAKMKRSMEIKRENLKELEYDIFTILLLFSQSKKCNVLEILYQIGFLKFICSHLTIETESHYSIVSVLNIVYHFSGVEKYRKVILEHNFLEKITQYLNASKCGVLFSRFNPKQLSFIYLSILSILYQYITNHLEFVMKYTIPLFEFFLSLNDEKLEEKTSGLILECCRTKEGSILLSDDPKDYFCEIASRTFSLNKSENIYRSTNLGTSSSARSRLSIISENSKYSNFSKAKVLKTPQPSEKNTRRQSLFNEDKEGKITTNNSIKGNSILIMSWMCYYDKKNAQKFYELCGMKHLLNLMRNYRNKTEFCMIIVDCLENVTLDFEKNLDRFIEFKGFDVVLSLLQTSTDDHFPYFVLGFVLNLLNCFKEKKILKRIIKNRPQFISYLLKKFIETRELINSKEPGFKIDLDFEERIFLIFKNIGMDEGLDYLNLEERKVITKIKPFKKYIELRIWNKIKNDFMTADIDPVQEDKEMIEKRLGVLEELKVHINEENLKIKEEIERGLKEKEDRFWNTMKGKFTNENYSSKRHILSRSMRRKITNKFLYYSYFSRIPDN